VVKNESSKSTGAVSAGFVLFPPNEANRSSFPEGAVGTAGVEAPDVEGDADAEKSRSKPTRDDGEAGVAVAEGADAEGACAAGRAPPPRRLPVVVVAADLSRDTREVLASTAEEETGNEHAGEEMQR
jgi:hypothetical protein